jgi:hypothetical protein
MVQFKLRLLLHNVYTGCAAASAINSVHATSSRSTREGLRSATTTNYVIPRLRTKFGERSFHPLVRLLPGTHFMLTYAFKLFVRLLKEQVKKYLFKFAFNIL